MPTDSATPYILGSAIPDPFAPVLAALLQKQGGERGAKILALWDSLAANLVSLIGDEGFNALYGRSLHLAAAAHPWLTDVSAQSGDRPRFAALAAALEGRPQEEIATSMLLLLSIFTGVLSKLIGKQLTLNILRAAWGHGFDEAAQKT